MRTEDVAWHRIEHESSVGALRRSAVELSKRLGFDETRAGELGIAVTEVATNQIKHAGGGTVLLRACRPDGESDPDAGVAFVAIDRGPGMPDVSASVADGHSTSGTLGIGLGALSRLSTSWDVWSRPDQGTLVVATFGSCDLVADPVGAAGRAGCLTRPMSGQDVCGDAVAIRVDDGVLSGLVADGLGHGPLAALASQAAVRAFRTARAGPPVDLLTAVHRGCSGTRGAAASVVQLPGDGTVGYAGVGNISGYVLDGRKQRGMISYPGITGHNARVLREARYELPKHAVIVLHSDGVTNKLRLDEYPGLLGRSPTLIAAAVLRDFGVRNDDASVLALAPVPA